jgi:FAD-linked oxidoreductase
VSTDASTLLRRGGRWSNWGRSESAEPRYIARPSTLDDVVETVAFARDHGLTVKPVGAGHSFTAIAVTDGIQVDFAGLRGLLAVDGTLVTLGAGTYLHELPAILDPLGLALQNMGDIDRQTVAGATSTGTHGTGSGFGGLATRIRAATLVTGSGDVLRVSQTENADLLPTVALGLGALGALVDVTIECVPSFLLQAREVPMPVATVLGEWTERIATSDHFEFYVWPHSDRALTKTNTRLPADAQRQPLGAVRELLEDRFTDNDVFRALLGIGRAAPALVPGINRLATKLTGNRSFTDHSYSVFTSPRTVRFREMEYALPVDAVPDAVRDVLRFIDDADLNIEFPIEVRSAAADELALSTASGRPTGYIAVHRYWRNDPTEYFAGVEAIMVAHGGRPHWGKRHTRTSEYLREVYPRFDEFIAARDRLDPDRVFGNDYLTRVLGP